MAGKHGGGVWSRRALAELQVPVKGEAGKEE